MATIVTINDYPLYAEMVADLIRKESGHEVHMLLSPIAAEEVTALQPDVLIISLVRKLDTIGHGSLHDFYTEVDGAKSYREISRSPETRGYPIILTSLGVREAEVPQDLPYKAFIHIPQELSLLLMAVDKLTKLQGKKAFES